MCKKREVKNRGMVTSYVRREKVKKRAMVKPCARREKLKVEGWSLHV
jgi:hypothetical protein